MGFDTRLIESKDALFSFADQDRARLEAELLAELPKEIHACIDDEAVSIQALLEKIGNRAAATNQDLFGVISELARAKEFEVFSSKGTLKRAGTRIQASDRLILPAQKTLFRF
ncbi:hypothetical protein ACFMPD_16740 [Sedimentitalea sp. HM32M-2]|uniref:hypothetical protein n=1 Tax=Sedimentitalea sp. HM32M-2 TaxID=3351566 RepID=UPI00362561A4